MILVRRRVDLWLVSSLTFPSIRIRFRNRFRNPCPYCRSVNAVAVLAIGEWSGWPRGLAGEFPAHPSRRSSKPPSYGNGKIERDYIFERKNGNGKLTETENVFYVRYEILTDERNSYVLLQRSTEIWLRLNGNVTLGTRC